ncbi:UNVERIFIED_CONTAM: hypothetical protein FKN15_057445 [Acipenser sinensis]
MFQTPCAAGEELRTLRSVRNFLEKSNEHLCVVCAVNTILRTLRTVTKYRVRKLLRWRRIIRSLCQENQAMCAPQCRSTREDTTQSVYPDRVVNTHTWSAQSVYQGGTEAEAAESGKPAFSTNARNYNRPEWTRGLFLSTRSVLDTEVLPYRLEKEKEGDLPVLFVQLYNAPQLATSSMFTVENNPV